jgi:pimeloyl-ACP methyl ester carboxylesterase
MKPVFLLLHSSGLSARQWRRLGQALEAKGAEVVAPDFIGHGRRAPWPDGAPFSYLEDVSEIEQWLAREGPAHVVGHSYGGLIGALATLRDPAKVTSLALYDPVTFGVLDPVEDRGPLDDISVVDEGWGSTPDEHERWLRAFVEYWGGAGAWAALREEARGEFRRVGWVVKEAVTTLAKDATPASAYRALAMPVVIMNGALSPRAASAVARRIASAAPRAKVVSVAGAGHMGPMTHPDAVNAVVTELISAS